jgi:hypothetical protein
MATASTMTPLRGEKRWAYLARAKTIRLASTNEDGSIYLSPLWFVVDDKRIYLPLDAGSRHGANAEAGRSLSGLVDSGDEYATVAGVRLMGSLKLEDDPDHYTGLEQLVFDKYFYVGHPYAEQYFEFGEFAGRKYYEFITDKVIGWDMREGTMPGIPESRTLPAFVTDRLLPDSTS